MSSTWIDEHIETFIRPYLGRVPTHTPSAYDVQSLPPIRVKALQAIWRQALKRAGGRPFLLAGRDVWLIEVLARIDGVPTIFRPDISSLSVPIVREDYSKCYCLDTCYRGSIPKTLKCEKWDLINYASEAYCGPKMDHQVFSHAKAGGHTRSLSSVLEASSKYWTRGTPNDYNLPKDKQVILQTLETKDRFTAAAVTTLYVASVLLGRRLMRKPFTYIISDTYYKLKGANQ